MTYFIINWGFSQEKQKQSKLSIEMIHIEMRYKQNWNVYALREMVIGIELELELAVLQLCSISFEMRTKIRMKFNVASILLIKPLSTRSSVSISVGRKVTIKNVCIRLGSNKYVYCKSHYHNLFFFLIWQNSKSHFCYKSQRRIIAKH